MKWWNDTRLRISWLRLRGSARGRRSDSWMRHFFCEGCQRAHGNRIMRVQVRDFLFCQRTYLTLSAEVRCIFMRKDSELMPERPQTNEAIPDEVERAFHAYSDKMGVGQLTRARVLADLDQKAAPGACVGPFRLAP